MCVCVCVCVCVVRRGDRFALHRRYLHGSIGRVPTIHLFVCAENRSCLSLFSLHPFLFLSCSLYLARCRVFGLDCPCTHIHTYITMSRAHFQTPLSLLFPYFFFLFRHFAFCAARPRTYVHTYIHTRA
ncbi:hypothetical protein IWX49DRAFT_352955 [Phyllosticta citricarpa]